MALREGRFPLLGRPLGGRLLFRAEPVSSADARTAGAGAFSDISSFGVASVGLLIVKDYRVQVQLARNVIIELET